MNALRAMLLGSTLAWAAAAGFSAPPRAPGALLVEGVNDASWQALFSRMAPTGPVLSQFAERRYFPFRKRPIELQGEMRLDLQRGLSLHYTQPEERTVVVDATGILQRDARGRSRSMPSDPHAAAMNAAMLPVLRFDRVEILRMFEIYAARDGEDWRLDFVPREPMLARTVGRLIVEGRGDNLRRLEFRRSEKQRVEILIETAQRNAVFDPATLKRFFR